jgi:transcriptional regulator with XRE-family HTH domain
MLRGMTETEIRKLLREACAATGSQAAFARVAGVTPAYIGDILAGKRRPAGPVLRALGVREKPREYELVGAPRAEAAATSAKRRPYATPKAKAAPASLRAMRRRA